MSGKSDQRDLLVETECGVTRGVVANGVRTWRAIPYAAPPIGALRFQAPQPMIGRELHDKQNSICGCRKVDGKWVFISHMSVDETE